MSAVRWSWVVFSVCFAVTAGAVGWIGWTALQLERKSQREADREESVRLALWRMESSLAPLIAEEASRPVLDHPVIEPTGKSVRPPAVDAKDISDAPIPSSRSPYVQLQFRVHADGSVAASAPPTPSADGRESRSAATTGGAVHELDVRGLGLALPPLPPAIDAKALAEAAPRQAAAPVQVAQAQVEEEPPPQTLSQRQSFRNDLEGQARSRRLQSSTYGYNAVPQQFGVADRGSAAEVVFGALTPVWLGDDLYLARRVRLDGADQIQGARLDWPRLRDSLLLEVRDLLPEARLEPARKPAGESLDTHTLAALPVRLLPGVIATTPAAGLTPLRTSLAIAWACVLLAAAASAILLAGALSLSERRRDFVSAVSHELRTPLTTFRMYTEMLANDMVPEAAKRRRYLEKLTIEAGRLSHLVENVLAYARLEGRRSPAHLAAHRVGDLIEAQEERLREHTAASGLELRRRYGADAADAQIRVEPASLEQILFNLIDNAAKYGRPTREPGNHDPAPGVDLEISVAPEWVYFDVRDAGPGIPQRERRLLFQPFTKSDSRAARSAPGVGLGLAICRRVARAMKGDLSVVPSTVGAHFRLRLPRAR